MKKEAPPKTTQDYAKLLLKNGSRHPVNHYCYVPFGLAIGYLESFKKTPLEGIVTEADLKEKAQQYELKVMTNPKNDEVLFGFSPAELAIASKASAGSIEVDRVGKRQVTPGEVGRLTWDSYDRSNAKKDAAPAVDKNDVGGKEADAVPEAEKKHFSSEQANALIRQAFALGYPDRGVPTYLKISEARFHAITGLDVNAGEAEQYAAWKEVKYFPTQHESYVFLDLKTLEQEAAASVADTVVKEIRTDGPLADLSKKKAL